MKQPFLWILSLACLCATCHAQASSSPVLVIDDVTVIDVTATGAPVLPHRTVLVRNGRIEQVVKTGDLSGEKSTGVHIYGKGKFLIPGLWDMHVHMVFGDWFP